MFVELAGNLPHISVLFEFPVIQSPDFSPRQWMIQSNTLRLPLEGVRGGEGRKNATLTPVLLKLT